MIIAEFRLELDDFSGPLDLLVYLIVRRQELDVLEVPVAEITRQYVAYLQSRGLIDLDEAGDFVVDAGTLIERKSRLTLPRPEETPIEAEPEIAAEPDGQLIQHLLAYKQFKDAAEKLEEHAARWRRRYPRLTDERPQTGPDPAADHIKAVELWDLVSALSRVLRKQVEERESNIRYDDTPISVYMEQLRNRIDSEGKIAFSSCFDRETDRSRIVAIFLAILELIRHHRFRAEQSEEFGEIWVLPPQ